MREMRAGSTGRCDLLSALHRDGTTTDQEVIRGGIKWGLIGLVLGLLPMIWLLYHFGAERGIKAIAFTVPIATFTTGLIIGLVKAKREWR